MSGDILGLYYLGRMLQHPETVEKVEREGFRGVQIFEGLLSLERIYVPPGLFYKRITPNSNLLGTVSSDFQEVVKIWQKRFA